MINKTKAAILAAKETVLGVLAAKQRCPISCSINIKKRGMSNHVSQGALCVGTKIGAWQVGSGVLEQKAIAKATMMKPACIISVRTTAFKPPMTV